jgi:hypothetical protein
MMAPAWGCSTACHPLDRLPLQGKADKKIVDQGLNPCATIGCRFAAFDRHFQLHPCFHDKRLSNDPGFVGALYPC